MYGLSPTADHGLNNPLLAQKPSKPAVKPDTAIQLAPDTTVAKKAEVAKAAKEPEVKQEAPEAQPEVKKTDYCIVLASHVSMKNANAFVEELHKRGFSEAEIFVRNKVTRVVCGHFETQNAAYNRLNRIRDNKGFEEAWVLKLKDKV